MAPLDELCSVCRRLDIASLFTTEFEHDNAIALGPLEQIIHKSETCSCCRAIVDSFLAQQPWQKLDVQRILGLLQADGKGTDVWIYSYAFIKNASISSPPVLRVGVSSSKGSQTSRLQWRKHVGDLQITQISAEEIGIARLGHGRKMRQTADATLARTWLDECLHSHGTLCSQPGSSTDQELSSEKPARLRVIDVVERRLVELLQGTEYIALSYCWPRIPGLTNTRASNIDFGVKGVMNLSNGLSATIDDACSFVHDLKERYLWVDALCIIQDDQDDKAHQINQMDLVYGNALLTIVVAPDKTDSEVSGLPGYRTESVSRHQTIHKTEGVELAIPKPCLEDILWDTRWETRGWTFQESHLSRRALFFTSQQLYYQCSCGVRCEDTAGEGHSPTAIIQHSTNLWNPKSAHDEDGEPNYGDLFLSRSPNIDANRALGSQDLLVLCFCRRELSFPSDILNAFQGIIKVLSHSMGTEFYAGLPVKWLDHALLWQPYGMTKRRSGFPSFSWAGWEGDVDAPTWLGTQSTRKLITWYRVVEGQLLICETDDVPTVEDQCSSLAVPPDSAISSLQLQYIPTHGWELVTMTQIASFSLSTYAVDHAHHSLSKDAELVWILDTNLRRAGLISLDKGWKAVNLTGNEKQEFIMLSVTERSRVDDIVNFDDAHYERRDWCLLNVMLVVFKSDVVAERVAVGYIHCDAWREAGPSTRVVPLV